MNMASCNEEVEHEDFFPSRSRDKAMGEKCRVVRRNLLSFSIQVKFFFLLADLSGLAYAFGFSVDKPEAINIFAHPRPSPTVHTAQPSDCEDESKHWSNGGGSKGSGYGNHGEYHYSYKKYPTKPPFKNKPTRKPRTIRPSRSAVPTSQPKYIHFPTPSPSKSQSNEPVNTQNPTVSATEPTTGEPTISSSIAPTTFSPAPSRVPNVTITPTISTSAPSVTFAPTIVASAPTTETSAPTIPASAPTTETSAPTIVASAPTTETSAPTIVASAPTTKTSAPTIVASSAPPTVTSAPTIVASSAPPTETSAPTIVATLPTNVTSAPTIVASSPTISISPSSSLQPSRGESSVVPSSLEPASSSVPTLIASISPSSKQPSISISPSVGASIRPSFGPTLGEATALPSVAPSLVSSEITSGPPSLIPSSAPTVKIFPNVPTEPSAFPTSRPTTSLAPTSQALCSVNPGCADLDGDCCPTREGVFLDCCVISPPVVSASPTTAVLTPVPSLSPSAPVQSIAPTMEKTILDTGSAPPTSTAQCSVNPGCADLTGECCPTLGGVFLYCCAISTPQVKTSPPTAVKTSEPSIAPTVQGTETSTPPSTSTAQCSVNPGCSDLTGDCCPNREGLFLDCCAISTPTQVKTSPPTAITTVAPSILPTGTAIPGSSQQCSANPLCEGLVGDCCPTRSGLFLECCSGPPSPAPSRRPSFFPTFEPSTIPTVNTALCTLNPECKGLVGDCCPTQTGLFLECCANRPTVAPTNRPTARKTPAPVVPKTTAPQPPKPPTPPEKPAPSTPAPTPGAIAGESVRATPFFVSYTLTGSPSGNDFTEAGDATAAYLEQYFQSFFSRSSSTNLLSLQVNAVGRAVDPARISFQATATFTQDTQSVPTQQQIDILMQRAFRMPEVQTLIDSLTSVPSSNAFSTTTGVEYSTGVQKSLEKGDYGDNGGTWTNNTAGAQQAAESDENDLGFSLPDSGNDDGFFPPYEGGTGTNNTAGAQQAVESDENDFGFTLPDSGNNDGFFPPYEDAGTATLQHITRPPAQLDTNVTAAAGGGGLSIQPDPLGVTKGQQTQPTPSKPWYSTGAALVVVFSITGVALILISMGFVFVRNRQNYPSPGTDTRQQQFPTREFMPHHTNPLMSFIENPNQPREPTLHFAPIRPYPHQLHPQHPQQTMNSHLRQHRHSAMDPFSRENPTHRQVQRSVSRESFASRNSRSSRQPSAPIISLQRECQQKSSHLRPSDTINLMAFREVEPPPMAYPGCGRDGSFDNSYGGLSKEESCGEDDPEIGQR